MYLEIDGWMDGQTNVQDISQCLSGPQQGGGNNPKTLRWPLVATLQQQAMRRVLKVEGPQWVRQGLVSSLCQLTLEWKLDGLPRPCLARVHWRRSETRDPASIWRGSLWADRRSLDRRG